MEIEPHEIETKTFKRAWRGFDRREVRDFLAAVATAVRDDDEFHRAGLEVATALRQMHELVTQLTDDAEREAAALRREALLDAQTLLAEAHEKAEQLRAEAEESAGMVRFEAAVWATRVRAEAEVDRQAAETQVEASRHELEEVEEQLARRAEDAVEQALKARELDVERTDRRITDLESTEIGVVARLRKIGREIAALVEAPIDPSLEPPIELPRAPARASGDSGDGVVLDLTGGRRLDAAVQSGFRRALDRPERPRSIPRPGPRSGPERKFP